ncbi:hypothetical protein PMG11_09357 [Penicillium brasilianum]|uniref:Very-long-chain (3R)-3-hydroxyacyl-CoA dehydratase n=1 Tax=Penicillium brasilianum TaxID=104259 RepID=A0A0F7TZC4_PENBI|nr:hypothetical protein PMG11_09357 [Penicillium brasilianum]
MDLGKTQCLDHQMIGTAQQSAYVLQKVLNLQLNPHRKKKTNKRSKLSPHGNLLECLCNTNLGPFFRAQPGSTLPVSNPLCYHSSLSLAANPSKGHTQIMASKQSTSRPSGPTGLTRGYLFTYNTANLLTWGTCLLYTASLIPNALASNTLSSIFPTTFNPLLLATQSLALLEVLHSLVRLVRAPFITTAMQVASRLLVVWGILVPFGGEIVGARGTQVGDYAYLGCVAAWGITEVIRYGFFAITLSGGNVPAWWTWLRYNTFYVLYPIGITSECTLIFKALGPAGELNPLFQYFLIAVLVIYVPGSYILYTHMIAQRRKVLRGKKRAD